MKYTPQQVLSSIGYAPRAYELLAKGILNQIINSQKWRHDINVRP